MNKILYKFKGNVKGKVLATFNYCEEGIEFCKDCKAIAKIRGYDDMGMKSCLDGIWVVK
jgi:hypothetical protein